MFATRPVIRDAAFERLTDRATAAIAQHGDRRCPLDLIAGRRHCEGRLNEAEHGTGGKYWAQRRQDRRCAGAAHPVGPHQVDTLILAVVTHRDGEWRIQALENVTLTNPMTGAAILRT